MSVDPFSSIGLNPAQENPWGKRIDSHSNSKATVGFRRAKEWRRDFEGNCCWRDYRKGRCEAPEELSATSQEAGGKRWNLVFNAGRHDVRGCR
jgi:hypothetical protein